MYVSYIVTKKSIVINHEIYYKDDKGHLLMVKIQIENKSLLLINLYAPNEDTPEFFVNMFKQISNANVEEVIMCGDFNMVMNPELDHKHHQIRYKPNSYKVLCECMDEMELLDLWRCKNPEKIFYTWTKVKDKKC